MLSCHVVHGLAILYLSTTRCQIKGARKTALKSPNIGKYIKVKQDSDFYRLREASAAVYVEVIVPEG